MGLRAKCARCHSLTRSCQLVGSAKTLVAIMLTLCVCVYVVECRTHVSRTGSTRSGSRRCVRQSVLALCSPVIDCEHRTHTCTSTHTGQFAHPRLHPALQRPACAYVRVVPRSTRWCRCAATVHANAVHLQRDQQGALPLVPSISVYRVIHVAVVTCGRVLLYVLPYAAHWRRSVLGCGPVYVLYLLCVLFVSCALD